MLFEDILITLLKAVDGERTISSPYHLLKGKKSGQTLQDIGYYKLHPYFGILPKLEKDVYDRAVQGLFKKGLIVTDGEVVRMTEKASAVKLAPTLLNGWKFRGNEQLFMARLSLLVQTLSHIHQNSRVFDPVVIAEDTQQWVKNYLKKINYRDSASCKNIKEGIVQSLNAVEVDESNKMIVLQRLSGLKIGGLTWEQIAREESRSIIDIQVQAVETLHGWMEVIEKGDFPLLRSLLDGVIQHSALTETARRTEGYFKNGRTLEEIAALRGLKTSTIEDHFVELAMNDPGFDILGFMEASLYAKIIAVSRTQNTKRLRDIKENVPEASYFQIRLALATKGEIQ
ncbi:helix-turn-helix domain-containing protein [Planococcus sp. CAU13]|uniref:helix-turn-helix domain-containing protein n=1 Tax=Planococcus sp. CAU13 TaxID=1541197 RepID=UPI00052FDFAC|nr:helix-turn-helix domain-containing protein [Planococcus sp. CAU13]